MVSARERFERSRAAAAGVAKHDPVRAERMRIKSSVDIARAKKKQKEAKAAIEQREQEKKREAVQRGAMFPKGIKKASDVPTVTTRPQAPKTNIPSNSRIVTAFNRVGQKERDIAENLLVRAEKKGAKSAKDVQISNLSMSAYRATQRFAATTRKGSPILQQKISVVSPTTARVIKYPVESVVRGVEMAGMLPGGVEVIAKRPEVIPAALTVGAIQAGPGLAAEARANPKQFVSDITTLSLLFGGPRALKAARTKPLKPGVEPGISLKTVKPKAKPKFDKFKTNTIELLKDDFAQAELVKVKPEPRPKPRTEPKPKPREVVKVEKLTTKNIESVKKSFGEVEKVRVKQKEVEAPKVKVKSITKLRSQKQRLEAKAEKTIDISEKVRIKSQIKKIEREIETQKFIKEEAREAKLEIKQKVRERQKAERAKARERAKERIKEKEITKLNTRELVKVGVIVNVFARTRARELERVREIERVKEIEKVAERVSVREFIRTVEALKQVERIREREAVKERVRVKTKEKTLEIPLIKPKLRTKKKPKAKKIKRVVVKEYTPYQIVRQIGGLESLF